MLTQINIKNFALIDELDLDLETGLTAITGETGAGKSIIIDAIELALGKRANGDIIRHNQDRADISVLFDITEIPDALNKLQMQDLAYDNECLIRRTIAKDGRSKSFINGTPVNLQILRELGELLINIHGQHEFQSLLKREKQLSLLDQFAKHQKILDAVKTHYAHWKKLHEEYHQLNNATLDISARIDFLSYQLRELNELSLGEDEVESLDKEHKQLANADTLINDCQAALSAVSESEGFSAIDLLNQALQALNKISDLNPELNNASGLLNTAVIQAEEAQNELRHFLDQLEINPDRLTHVESRLTKIHDIARKHHVSPEALTDLHKKMQLEFNQIEHRDEHLDELKSNLQKAEADYFNAAKKLTASRQKATKKLSQLVTENMQKLGMKGGGFNIEINPREKNPHKEGMEGVEFCVTANAGQPLKPLNKVASGGELSRISLAIQVITAQYSATPTLIFDEVDVGIGGAIAEVVGKLLRELGSATQTLCITHLAQVAALGHQQLKVQKETQKNITTASLVALEKTARIEEIARMAGGIEITEQTIAHAEALLNNI